MIPATLTDLAGGRRHVDLPGAYGPEYVIDGARLFVRQPGPWTDREVYHEVHCAWRLADLEALARREAAETGVPAAAGVPAGTATRQESAA